jgi:hypothetical protein
LDFIDGEIMKISTLGLSVILVLILLTMTACVPGGGNFHNGNPAGLFIGIWHGWIAPVSLIIGFFNPSVRIYEMNNTGFWYDFGFYIAIISGFGGVSLTRNKLKSNRNN